MAFRIPITALICSLCTHPLSADDMQNKREAISNKIAALQQERQLAATQAQIVGRYADHFLTIDWMNYRRELELQTSLQEQVKLLDAEIEALQKEQATMTKSSTGEKKP